MPYQYTVVQSGIESRLPYVVGFYPARGIPAFIDAAVGEIDRAYILGHEIREQTKSEITNLPEAQRCRASLEVELADVQAERSQDAYEAYVRNRGAFFKGLVSLYEDPQQRASVTEDFIRGIAASSIHLEGLIAQFPSSSTD